MGLGHGYPEVAWTGKKKSYTEQYYAYVNTDGAKSKDPFAFAKSASLGRQTALPGIDGRNNEEYGKSEISAGTLSGKRLYSVSERQQGEARRVGECQ